MSIPIISKEEKPLVLVGKWLKLQEPEEFAIRFWSTDVTKLEDGFLARLKDVFTGGEGETLVPTNFGAHIIGCCSFYEDDWDTIMKAREKYSKKPSKKPSKKSSKKRK